MKKFLMLFAVVAFLGTSATAQCTKSKTACTKSKTTCTKAKTTATSAELPACPKAAAAKLASLDESIEAKTCAKSGNTSYYKKSTCATSGKVSLKEVKYCNTAKTFVNAAPSRAAEVKEVKADAPAKKACTKSTSTAKKACCASKAKTASTCTKKSSTVEKKSSDVKLVKKVENK